MGRSREAATTFGSAAPENAFAIAAFRTGTSWWLFSAFVIALKLVLLWLDPTPKLFMGDSGSYIWTALTGWIPPDRSYFYGYLVRWFAVWPHGFTPLLLVQALASGVTAIVFALICSRLFELSDNIAFSFGALCALDPCQLVWERYIMTETFSLLLYVLVLYWSLGYLRDRRVWQLAVVQALSVLLIGFRMSYLLVVQACTILLPVIAFGQVAVPLCRTREKVPASMRSIAATGFGHVIISIALMFVLHGAYKYGNGLLSKRRPAYLYDVGAHLVSVWAPALQPSDATDPRFRDLIANGHQFRIDNLRLRDAQQYSEEFLIDRWRKIEKNPGKRDRIARETALNALRRRPLEIVELTLKTYLGFWGIHSMQWHAEKDLGYSALTDGQIKMLAEKFRFVTVKEQPVQPFSLSQRYFLAAWPYYFIVIISPLICAMATWVARNRAFAILLFVHASILMLVITALSPRASVRYLQPLSILTLLSIAICVDWFGKRTETLRRQASRANAV